MLITLSPNPLVRWRVYLHVYVDTYVGSRRFPPSDNIKAHTYIHTRMRSWREIWESQPLPTCHNAKCYVHKYVSRFEQGMYLGILAHKKGDWLTEKIKSWKQTAGKFLALPFSARLGKNYGKKTFCCFGKQICEKTLQKSVLLLSEWLQKSFNVHRSKKGDMFSRIGQWAWALGATPKCRRLNCQPSKCRLPNHYHQNPNLT
jgi:hypothetical protein